MDIVVLDGYTLNPGDLSWKDLKSLGTLTVYDKTAADSIFERAKEAEIVLTNKTVLTREIIETLPKLRYIGVLATGYNTVDIDAARERGIPVCNIPAYSTDSVAQLVFAFILEMAMQTAAHDADVKAGGWCRCEPDYGIERKNAGDYRIRKYRKKNGGNRRRLRNGNCLH